MKKLPKGYRRWHVESNEHGYIYTHGGFSTKAYALKVARELSESQRVYVVDMLTNAIVWGY
jgi:hypothetical protein